MLMAGAAGVPFPPKEVFTLSVRFFASVCRGFAALHHSFRAMSGWTGYEEIAMTDAIRELKVRAEILHKSLQAQQPAALKRLRRLPAWRRAADEAVAQAAASLRRHDCLNLIAVELGFPNWTEARRTLTGAGSNLDFGNLLYPPRCCGHLNRWYTSYEAAASARASCQGFLLAYRRQYFVADRYFIESLGLDADDPDWTALGFDPVLICGRPWSESSTVTTVGARAIRSGGAGARPARWRLLVPKSSGIYATWPATTSV
jgi:hypothetical protein